MSIDRTTPESLGEITDDRIIEFGIKASYFGTVLNRENLRFYYTVENLDATGAVVRKVSEFEVWDNLPSALRAELRSIRNKVILDATNKGLIGAGVDTDDLSDPA